VKILLRPLPSRDGHVKSSLEKSVYGDIPLLKRSL
jgi:hypothetical protein